MKKKIVSRKKFIFSIAISLLIWILVVNLLSFILITLIDKLTNNVMLCVFMACAMWILNSALIVLLCYINNKKKIVSKNELGKTKISVLIIFYIFIVGLSGINNADFMNLIIEKPIVWILLMIIQMFLITFVNDAMFKKYMHYDKKNFNVFLIAVIIECIIITLNYVVTIKNKTLTCSNYKDKIVFLFYSDGISSIKINDKKASGEEFLKYSIPFISDFAWNNMYEDKSYLEKINMHKKDVASYFEKHGYSCNYNDRR